MPNNLTTALTPTGDSLYVTAAQKAAVADDSGGWVALQRAAMKIAAPGVSTFVPFGFRDMVKVAAPTIGGVTATVTSAAIAGGGLSYVTSAVYPISPTILLNPSVQPFAFAFRGAFPTPVTGRWCFVALDYGGNDSMGMGSYYAVGTNYDGQAGTDARTKLVVQSSAASSYQRASQLVIDGAVHTYLYAWDLSTVKFYCDGVLIASIANATNHVETHNCKLGIDAHTAAMVISDLLFGY